MSILSRRRAGTFEQPEAPPAPPPTLTELLDAERIAHAHEKEAHDLARAMLRERFEEIEGLRAQIETALTERDAMKAAVDALEAQLTAPAEAPASAPLSKPRR